MHADAKLANRFTLKVGDLLISLILHPQTRSSLPSGKFSPSWWRARTHLSFSSSSTSSFSSQCSPHILKAGQQCSSRLLIFHPFSVHPSLFPWFALLSFFLELMHSDFYCSGIISIKWWWWLYLSCESMCGCFWRIKKVFLFLQGIFVLGLPFALVRSGYLGLVLMVLSAWVCNHTGRILVACLYEDQEQRWVWGCDILSFDPFQFIMAWKSLFLLLD